MLSKLLNALIWLKRFFLYGIDYAYTRKRYMKESRDDLNNIVRKRPVQFVRLTIGSEYSVVADAEGTSAKTHDLLIATKEEKSKRGLMGDVVHSVTTGNLGAQRLKANAGVAPDVEAAVGDCAQTEKSGYYISDEEVTGTGTEKENVHKQGSRRGSSSSVVAVPQTVGEFLDPDYTPKKKQKWQSCGKTERGFFNGGMDTEKLRVQPCVAGDTRLVTRDRTDHHPTEISYIYTFFTHMSHTYTCTIILLHTRTGMRCITHKHVSRLRKSGEFLSDKSWGL